MPTTHNHKKILEEFDPTKIEKMMGRKKLDFSELSEGMRDLFRAEAYSRKHKIYPNINILNGYKPQPYYTGMSPIVILLITLRTII